MTDPIPKGKEIILTGLNKKTSSMKSAAINKICDKQYRDLSLFDSK